MSVIVAIQRCLSNASKTGKGGVGFPEFIITSPKANDFVILIECKASTKDHERRGSGKPNPAKYAVDGVLHYAHHLGKSYNVIAIAASGQARSDFRLSTFVQPKGSEYSILTNRAGQPLDKILPFDEMVGLACYDPEIEKQRHSDLIAFSKELHEFMRDRAKVTEDEKPLLVSGSLIALYNDAFRKAYSAYAPEELPTQWLRVIGEEIDKAKIPYKNKTDNMKQPYSTIAVHPVLCKATDEFPKGILYEIVERLDKQVWPFISVYHNYDVVGQFYGEFLKYAGGDKKGLGIVLTPRHITDLFARVANVTKQSKVLDICCGTGGFLISAMFQMMQDAKGKREENAIKSKGLIGIEQQPKMFALAASNMILRGDGKANLFQGDCFDSALTAEVTKRKCDVGMINPPYSQKDANLRELVFVRQMLNCLVKRGMGIAIVPMACAISPHPLRDELLTSHTLEAVMSMPSDLFYPVGVVPCIMVFTAHIPHKKSGKRTWFGYWKMDGFKKVRHMGRADPNDEWPAIRDGWIRAYRNCESIPGLSISESVGPEDEWCAEAYMETSYESLSSKDFRDTLRDYMSFEAGKENYKFLATVLRLSKQKQKSAVGSIDVSKWKRFTLDELFALKKGRRIVKADIEPGGTPFVAAIEGNNGVREYISRDPLYDGNMITINYNGSVGEAFYQPSPFWASDDVNVLCPRFNLTTFTALFLVTIIKQERYRFNYGRKWHLERMEKSEIRLPVKSNGMPDWEFMEKYTKSLPCSGSI